MVSARVLLSDDHPIVMSGFANALASYGIEVVGQVVTLEQVLPSYDALLPDVLILDIRFGSQKETGLDAARHVLAAHPTANVIFLSQFDQDSLIKEAYQLGGRAFLPRTATRQTLPLPSLAPSRASCTSCLQSRSGLPACPSLARERPRPFYKTARSTSSSSWLKA